MGVQCEEILMRYSMQKYQGRLTKKRENYGFIRYTNSASLSRDVFVHFSNYLHGFVPELNQIVEFDFGPSPVEDKPPVAIRVRVIKTADEVLHDFNKQINAGADALGAKQGGVQ
jgi:cold shock CspA family protein